MPKKEPTEMSEQEGGAEKHSTTAGKKFDFKHLPEDILDEVSGMMSIEEAESKYEEWAKEFGIQDREKFFEALKREKAAMLTEALGEHERIEQEQTSLVSDRGAALAERKALRGPDLQRRLIDLQNEIYEMGKRLKRVQGEHDAVDAETKGLNKKKKKTLDEFASRGVLQRLFSKKPSTEDVDGKIQEMEEAQRALEAKVTKAEEELEDKKQKLEDLRKEDDANAKKYKSDPRVKTLDLKLKEIQAAMDGPDPRREALEQEIVDHYQFIHSDFDFSALSVSDSSFPAPGSRNRGHEESEMESAQEFEERKEATVKKAKAWLKEQKKKRKT